MIRRQQRLLIFQISGSWFGVVSKKEHDRNKNVARPGYGKCRAWWFAPVFYSYILYHTPRVMISSCFMILTNPLDYFFFYVLEHEYVDTRYYYYYCYLSCRRLFFSSSFLPCHWFFIKNSMTKEKEKPKIIIISYWYYSNSTAA